MRLEHLVCDVNGTLAVDGKLVDGVRCALNSLRGQIQVHLLTADTYGQQTTLDQQLNLTAVRLKPGQEAEQKAEYIHQLGADKVAAIGQGVNDALMLRAAAIGICLISPEGTAAQSLHAADVVILDINSALALFEHPQRLVATLRK